MIANEKSIYQRSNGRDVINYDHGMVFNNDQNLYLY